MEKMYQNHERRVEYNVRTCAVVVSFKDIIVCGLLRDIYGSDETYFEPTPKLRRVR
jgi:hypothetical protein